MELLNTNRTQDIAWANEVKATIANIAPEALSKIDQAITDYCSKKISVAVVGLQKRGKSTFCNAFLKQANDDLAPIGKLPVTGLVTKYTSSKTRKEAEVIFTNQTILTIPYSMIRQYVTEEGNPANGKNVDYVNVYGDFAFDDDVELLDMPGDDSIHALHTQIVYKYLPEADVIIFLSSVQDPITVPELSLLSKIASNEHKKIFFAINKCDQADEDEIQDAEEHNQKVITANGITLQNRIYKISAKNALQGRPDADFTTMLKDITTFVTENKLKLHRGAFISDITSIAAPALEQLGLSLDARKQSAEELDNTQQKLNNAKISMDQQAKNAVKTFITTWNETIDNFANAMPTYEAKACADIKKYIEAIPSLSMGDKTLQKLPAEITNIIDNILTAPCQEMTNTLTNAIQGLNADFPAIQKFLSDNDYRVKASHQQTLGMGNVIVGGTFFLAGKVIGGITAGAITATSSVPILGPLFGTVTTVAGSPFLALSGIFLGCGILLGALPLFGWIRHKHNQKKEILDTILEQVHVAFKNMTNSKLPQIRKQGQEFVDKIQEHYTNELNSLQHSLDDAIAQRKLLSAPEFQVQTAQQQASFDAIQQALKHAPSLN